MVKKNGYNKAYASIRAAFMVKKNGYNAALSLGQVPILRIGHQGNRMSFLVVRAVN